MKKFKTGEKFLYLGRTYPLIVSKQVMGALIFEKDTFFLNEFNHHNAEVHFLSWYKRQAMTLFNTRVSNYARQVQVSFVNITLSNANSKWGSCSEDNKLMFNWRLIMAPLDVIDSVIFHELSHILEKNHSRKFWRRVTMWYPLYEEKKAWLDTYGHTLIL